MLKPNLETMTYRISCDDSGCKQYIDIKVYSWDRAAMNATTETANQNLWSIVPEHGRAVHYCPKCSFIKLKKELALLNLRTRQVVTRLHRFNTKL